MKNKNTKQSKHDHPGRPKYTPVYPRTKEWTFTDWMEANGIDTDPDSKEFGKGSNCTMLTLRKNMERDMYFHKPGKAVIAANRTRGNPRSNMVIVRGVTAEPNSESGLGRRATLYALRSKGVSVKHTTVTPKASTKPAVKASAKSQTPVSDALDKIHAALTTPDPAPAVVTVPAVTIAPETPAPVVPAPAPAPVAETPAPVAPEAVEAETVAIAAAAETS
jgi:hypothetical protein